MPQVGYALLCFFHKISSCYGLLTAQIPGLRMLKLPVLAILLAVLAPWLVAPAQAQVYKCSANGAAQYQQSPCPSNEGRKPPTVQELNAARQKQLAKEQASPATQNLQVTPLVTPELLGQSPANPAASTRTSFRCDGRKYCTQMTSCQEAKYFLSNCPGVKMDGDGDGIPCEEQWCKP